MYEKLDELLKDRGISLVKLAQESGVPKSTLYEWKSGKYTPKLDKLEKISNYFGVPVDYFLTKKAPPKGSAKNDVDLSELLKSDILFYGKKQLTAKDKRLIGSIIQSVLDEED